MLTTPITRRHEQRRLGPEVVLQVGVEVEVVLRQVGEDGHVEAGTRHPAQAERVARHLHRGGGHPALHHDREQRLQVGRLRGGQRAGQPLLPDPELHPADQAGQVPGRAQPGLEQVGARGLAAGPGDADQPQPGSTDPRTPSRRSRPAGRAGPRARTPARRWRWPGPGRPGRSAPRRRRPPPRPRRTPPRARAHRAARRTGHQASPTGSRG